MAGGLAERLRLVLELEERQGWRNRAVVGGFAAMAGRLCDEAAEGSFAGEPVDEVARLMRAYDAADMADRPELARVILRFLDGDTEGAADALALSQEDASPHAIHVDELSPLEPTDVAQRRVRARKAAGEADGDGLQSSTAVLPGVGKVTAEHLTRLGIDTVEELLWHLPSRYEDYSKLRRIAELQPGEQVTVVANLWDVTERKVSMNRSMVQGVLGDGTGTLRATWWNRWIKKQLTPGSTMRFSGKVSLFMGQKTLENPIFEEIDEEMVAKGRIEPVYPLTEGIQGTRMRGMVRTALAGYVDLIDDPLPETVRDRYALPDLPTALRQAHVPDDQESLDRAWQRLAFEEFFYLQLGVLERRAQIREQEAIAVAADPELVEGFLSRLPFELTGAQRRVLDEVLDDMARTTPMTRLVQGDVGSGKTVVAAAAMLAAFAAGAQSALLAPTQILAEQHYRSLSRMLAGASRSDGKEMQVELLTGRVTGAERARILDGIRSGMTDVVVGTTALIQEAVEFERLAFAIVDEQHRFGVEQRGALRSKGVQPHLLVMSATPIPRSLALTVYGDLDVSVIDEMPPGREPVRTRRFRQSEHERLYRFMRKEVREGRQGFIVYPLVEESEKLEAGSAVEEYERLGQEVFPNLRLALLHGRMSGQEKDEVMSAFAAGEYDVLVSTTVVEVGIDVPNASLMIIEDAERFGLAQLHQLRGRVGRGQYASYCALFSKAESADANERLHALEEMYSGFDLAEKDLELRGPGDFLGTRQSGLPDLRAASLSDMQTLVTAREAARAFFASEDIESYPALQRAVERLWQGHGDVS